MKKKNLLIVGSLVAVAVVFYMYKNKKQTVAPVPEAPKLAKGEVAVLDKDGNVRVLTQQFVAKDTTEPTLGGGKSNIPRFA